MYSQKVIDRFKQPLHAGEMADADAVGEEGGVRCGDVMRIYLKIKDDKIEKASFLTYGCVAAIATTDALCEMIEGMSLDEAWNVQPKDIVEHLGGDIPPIKFHCSVLGDKALRNAIRAYRGEPIPERDDGSDHGDMKTCP